MFTKHISELLFSDIDDLVNVRKEREGYHLDYKGEIGNPDKSKVELSKDVSSFGNTDGGFLIIGVEKDTYKLIGIEPTIQNKPVDEWLNQVLSTNIDPPLFYYDPMVIHLPDSDRVIVVIHIPESSKKPHMVSESHQYFIRINDRKKPSTHNQVREMFDFSRYRTEEYREFLIKRNLFHEDSPEFGQSLLTKQLYSDFPEKLNLKKPLVIFSLIPKYPNEERIRIPFQELKSWLEKNNRGFQPIPQFSPFSFNDYSLTLDGVVFNRRTGDGLKSYFEILNNGYIECGFSYFTSGYYETNQVTRPCLNWTFIVGIELYLLGFSRQFFEQISFFDNVEIQISFVNVLNFKLLGWNKGKYDDYRFRNDDTVNLYHNSFKINHIFNPKTMSDHDIQEIVKQHSLKLGRGFGLDKELCFDDKGNLDPNGLSFY